MLKLHQGTAHVRGNKFGGGAGSSAKMEEVGVCTEAVLPGLSEVIVAIPRATTCSDLLEFLREEYGQDTSRQGGKGDRWHLLEDWNGCSKWKRKSNIGKHGLSCL